MQLRIHANYLIALSILTVSIFAVILYSQEHNRSESFSNLMAQTMMTDLPSHRLRSSPFGPIHSDPMINEMLSLLRAEDYVGAHNLIEQVIETQPENVVLHYYAGCLAHRSGHLEVAKQYFQVVRMNSDLFYREALKKLALIYYQSQQTELCRKMLQDLQPIATGTDIIWTKTLSDLL